MVVGAAKIILRLYGNNSLKGKRHVVQKIKERIKNRFNVSVAEVSDLDLWQKAGIGVVTVSNDVKVVQSILNQVVDMVENTGLGQILDFEIQIY
jgi:uncharacterized protein YlxP (DUF503 family)